LEGERASVEAVMNEFCCRERSTDCHFEELVLREEFPAICGILIADAALFYQALNFCWRSQLRAIKSESFPEMLRPNEGLQHDSLKNCQVKEIIFAVNNSAYCERSRNVSSPPQHL
jgi:hypothetical protein